MSVSYKEKGTNCEQHPKGQYRVETFLGLNEVDSLDDLNFKIQP